MGKHLFRPLFLLAALLLPSRSEGGGASAEPFPDTNSGRLVRDQVGRQVRVVSSPRRIVSLAPSVTETLFALEAGDRVVGVTDFCDYPPGVMAKTRIGGMVNPNWEAILGLKPDLLVATTSGNDRNVVAQAQVLRLPLYFLDTPDIESLLDSLTRLGDLLGSPSPAEALRIDLTARLLEIERKIPSGPRPTVLFLVWGDPLMVPGRGTFLNDALKRSGCASITSDGPPGWPTYNLETLLVRDPQWILAADQNAPFLEGLQQHPGWRTLDAVRRGRTVLVSPALERPAPRVVEAMEQLQEMLGRKREGH